jgi:hypothetical protein
MIGHQTIGVADPPVARDDVSERFNKQLAVKVVEKDLLTEVSPTGSDEKPHRRIPT